MTDGGRSRTLRRRSLLAGLCAGLAGCVGVGDDERATTAPPASDDPDPTSSPTATGDGTAHSPDGERREDTPTAAATPDGTTSSTPTTAPLFPGYETTDVAVRSPDGQLLGSVNAAIAATFDRRYTGLSDTESLPEDRGMLFVFPGASERTFVMRRMSFPLDMIFVDGDREITVVHQAPAPGPNEDGENIRRSGFAQYVLEVNRGWSAERGVGEGDRLDFELP